MSGIYHEWNGTVLTVTSDSGTSSADLKGEMGVRGAQGVAGESAFSQYATESKEYAGCYYREVNGEKEWINPPFINNVEYRSIERVDGNAIYLRNRDGEIIYRLETEEPTKGRAYARLHGGYVPYNWGSKITTAGWYRLGNLAPLHSSARTCAFRLMIGGNDSATNTPTECIIDIVAGVNGNNSQIKKVIGTNLGNQITKVRVCTNSTTSPRSYDIDVYYAPLGEANTIVMHGMELLGVFNQCLITDVTSSTQSVRAELDLTASENTPIEDSVSKGCYYRMVNGEKEWINPPMKSDIEYRTTERYLNNPVYTKIISFPSVPTEGNISQKRFFTNPSNEMTLAIPIRVSGTIRGLLAPIMREYANALPYKNKVEEIDIYAEQGNEELPTSYISIHNIKGDFSWATEVYAQVWYYKI